MLSNVGYFRHIDCPGIKTKGYCNRPYCHFRHSSVSQNSDQSALELSDEFNIGSSIHDQNAVEVPFSKSNSINTAFDYIPLSTSCSTSKYIDRTNGSNKSPQPSVLQAARGACKTLSSQNNSKTNIQYKQSNAANPLTDLEYDPLSNFNLKDDKAKHLIPIEKEKNDLVPTIDLTVDEISESDLQKNGVDDEDESLHVNQENVFKDLPQVYKNANNFADVSGLKSTNLSDPVTIVISSSEDETDQEKIYESVLKVSAKQSFSETKRSSEVKGGDKSSAFTCDKEVLKESLKKIAATKDQVSKSVSNGIREKLKLATEKKTVKKINGKNTEASKTIKNKQASANSNLTLQNAKPISKTTSPEKVIKEKKKQTSNRAISMLKAKKLKTASSLKHGDPTTSISSVNDISKYVSKDEIDKLDKELNDVGGFDECFRIYQESINSKKSEKSTPLQKRRISSTNDIKKADADKSKSLMESEECYVPPEKSRRVAHSAASQSAKNLNREPRQARKLLTPAQAMMQRMETIRLEQEERLLTEISSRATSTNKFYKSTKLKEEKRVAHKPPTYSSKSVLSKKATALPKVNGTENHLHNKKRPFEDLRSTPTSGTAQGTLPKGFSRTARTGHLLSNASGNDIDEPRILPDRHSKIPTNVRQRYLSVFCKECLRIHDNNRLKAFEMAKLEEEQCNNRSKSKNIYLSLAASSLKRLRAMNSGGTNSNKSDELEQKVTSVKWSPMKVAFKSNNLRIAHGSTKLETAAAKNNLKTHSKTKTKTSSLKKGLASKSRMCNDGYSLVPKEKQDSLSAEEIYENLCRYIMTEVQLNDNGYPRPGDLRGTCQFMTEQPRPNADKTKKTCARCGKEFVLYIGGHFAVEDECIHHWSRAYSTKVGSHWEKRYMCCQAPIGSEGCSIGDTHVHKENVYDCNGYVETIKKGIDVSDPGVYALDCEMAYTVNGLELIRVSVVNFDCQLVYDTLVQPKGKILDYNTRWSGLDADDLKGVTTSLREVQAVLLDKFSSDTILVGHSLESDLKALRMVHSSVIDTAIVFPHRLGPPYKRALRNLMAENLGIIIQNSVDEGHDSTEDASACIKLMKWKLNEDMKVPH